MNVIERFRSLPQSTRRLLSVGMILALVVALPLFIWALITGNFNPNKKAATGEPSVCIPQNKIITVTPSSDTNGTCHDIQTAVNAATGDGYSIIIAPGGYDVPATIVVDGKSNLNITGNNDASNPTIINFNSSSYAFRITASSGSLQWLTIQGGGSNQTSGGAIESWTLNNFTISNNKIFDFVNGITTEGANIDILNNLIANNSETALILQGLYTAHIEHNTIVSNGSTQNKPSVVLNGSGNSQMFFNKNIIANGAGPGIFFNSYQNFTTFNNNNFFGNNPNYSGMADQTGINGNIASDPLLNSNASIFCPMQGSPVVYGNPANFEYMGYISTCGSYSFPTPTPAPTGNANSCNGNCSNSFDCLGGLICHQGSCRNPSCATNSNCLCTVATSTPTPTASSTATASPIVTSKPFSILLRLNGVNGDSAHLANVSVRFINKALDNFTGYITPQIPITYVGNGIYKVIFGVLTPTLPAASDYSIVLKGEKHLGTKFCSASGQTTHCMGSETGNITVSPDPTGLVSLDFTGIPLEPGDLFQQDGVVDSSDFNKIKTLLSKPCAELTNQDKLTADVDYNGCVNAKDAFLVRKTLETRYDEN